MAAVTVNSKKYNVDGSLRQNIYNISGGNGDTLVVGLFNVNLVNIGDNGIANIPSGATAVSQTPSVGFCTITFTSGGAYVGAIVEVVGN